MILKIATRNESIRLKKRQRKEYYFDYNEIEIKKFRWLKNHEFEYLPLNSNIWFKLEKNQEIIGLTI